MPVDKTDIRRMVHRIASAGFHYCGTCRMGVDTDAMAVVTPATKVRGVEGLRIADGSIMPEVVSGNLNAPIMMIGEHCADLMLNG